MKAVVHFIQSAQPWRLTFTSLSVIFRNGGLNYMGTEYIFADVGRKSSKRCGVRKVSPS